MSPLALLLTLRVALAGDLPLESIRYTVDVTGPVANVIVEQMFHNDSDQFIEATYVFPLHAEAAVDQMRIEIGDRVIEGEIHDRKVAQRLYDEAKTQGQVAALTEQERPNIFTQQVANIGPGETIRVVLGVIQPVPHEDGAFELILPLVVAPRFIPAGVPDAERISPPVLDPPEGQEVATNPIPVDIDVDIHASVPIVGAESATHTIDLAIDGEGLSASVYGVPATRDFVLRWWTATDEPQVGMLVHGEHALLTFEPPITSEYVDRVPRELVWIVDTSCSMAGEPLEMAKRAMKEALALMDPLDSIGVLNFGSTVQGAFASPVPATPWNTRRARTYVAALQSNGGTEMVAAYEAALALPRDPERHRIVCLLTDGLIGNEREVLGLIAAHPEVTFSTVGIGSSPNRYLLDLIAELGGGLTAYATLEEEPEYAIDRLVDAMDRPVLTEVVVDWGDWEVESAYPSRIPDLHVGKPASVAAHVLGGSGPVSITGRLGSGTFTQLVHPVTVSEGRPLVTTWARKHVSEVHRRWIRKEIPDEAREILAIGLRWGILTQYTAFLAVERRIANPDGAPVPVDQGLSVPDGQVLTKEFLSRIPSGRSYQTVVFQSAGVTGTYSLNFNFDAIDQLPTAGVGDELPTLGGAVLPSPAGDSAGGNRVDAVAGLGATYVPGGGALDATLSASGPLRVDRAWLALAGTYWTARLGDVVTGQQNLAFKLTAQPNPSHRFFAAAEADPTSVSLDETTSRYGGAASSLGWNWFLNPDTHTHTWATVSHRTVRGDSRDAFEVGTDITLLGVNFGGSHDLEFGITGNRFGWSDTSTKGNATLATAFAEDSWEVDAVTVDARVAGGLLALDGRDAPRVLPSPGVGISWDVGQRSKTRIGLAGSRNWDVSAIAIGIVDANGLPSRVDTATLGVDQELVPDLILHAAGFVRQDHLAFVPLPDHTEIDATEAFPWFDAQVWGANLGLSRWWSDRWHAKAEYRLIRVPGSESALLSDPRAWLVPGFLDAWRPHAFDAACAWQLPTDPWTLTVGLNAGVASRIDAQAEGWWLLGTSELGAQASQRFPLRRGGLELHVGATWAVRDQDASFLPLAVLAAEPGVPGLDTQPPFQFRAGVEWEF